MKNPSYLDFLIAVATLILVAIGTYGLYWLIAYTPYANAVCSQTDSTFYIWPQGCVKNTNRCFGRFGDGWIELKGYSPIDVVCGKGDIQRKLVD